MSSILTTNLKKNRWKTDFLSYTYLQLLAIFFTLIKETTEQIESNHSVFQFPNDKYKPI